jgi:hypothetical protein
MISVLTGIRRGARDRCSAAHGLIRRGNMPWIIFAAALAGLVWWLTPILDHHEGTAAWVQAAGAILIIGATAWIASRSSREAAERERIARQQLRERIAVLARNCLKAVDFLENYVPPVSDPRGNFLRAYAPSDFEVPMDGLASVPLHHIGDATLITAVLTLRSVMGQIKKHFDDVVHNHGSLPVLETVRSQRTLALDAIANVLQIVEGTVAEKESTVKLAIRSPD